MQILNNCFIVSVRLSSNQCNWEAAKHSRGWHRSRLSPCVTKASIVPSDLPCASLVGGVKFRVSQKVAFRPFLLKRLLYRKFLKNLFRRFMHLKKTCWLTHSSLKRVPLSVAIHKSELLVFLDELIGIHFEYFAINNY